MTPTHPPRTDWTIETALAHALALMQAHDEKYGTRFDGIEKATAAALQSAERAVLKAEAAAEKRFEGVNEFRNTLSDQQRNLIPRAEVEAIVRGLTDKITSLEKQMDNQIAERAGLRGGWGYAVGVIGLMLMVVSLIVWMIRIGGGA